MNDRADNAGRAVREQEGLSLLLPWPPSRNALWRAVRCGRGRMQLKSREYNEWWAEAEKAAAAQPLPARFIGGRVTIRLDLHPPSRRPYDPDNYSKAALDFLVKQGFIEGDTQKTVRGILTVPHDKGTSCGVWVHIDGVGDEGREAQEDRDSGGGAHLRRSPAAAGGGREVGESSPRPWSGQ